MINNDIIGYYDKMSEKIENPLETRNNSKNFSMYDINFMKSFSNTDMNLLDLGSGTGLLINSLTDSFNSITAIEKYENFSKFIANDLSISVINEDLLCLDLEKEFFDIVSIFGVMNYFSYKEARIIYQKAYDYLKPNGVLVIKHQMGIDKDITVSGYSEELKCDYYSNYRYINNEINILESIGFSSIEKFDIYPDEYNRWENTHFYALTMKKNDY